MFLRAYIPFFASLAVFGVMPLIARAGDVPGSYAAPTAEQSARAAETDIVFEMGLGGNVAPAYEGASEYSVSPSPIFDLEYLRLPFFTLDGGEELGLSVGPSFNFIGERESSDYDELAGLDDVDATFEAGIKLAYEWTFAEIYGETRYAFGGAEGLVGNIGANAIFRPTPYLRLKIGPIATFAGDDYMNTYFGVTPDEALNTGGRLSAYQAEAGIKSAGISTEARYEFRPDWFLNAEASYTSMLGDAEDSPIVEVGEKEQFTFGLGVSRRFSFDLY